MGGEGGAEQHPTPARADWDGILVSATAEGDLVTVAWPREYKDPRTRVLEWRNPPHAVAD